MKLTEQQFAEFSALTEPLMKFLAENCHPHCSIYVQNYQAELLEGQASHINHSFACDGECDDLPRYATPEEACGQGPVVPLEAKTFDRPAEIKANAVWDDEPRDFPAPEDDGEYESAPTPEIQGGAHWYNEKTGKWVEGQYPIPVEEMTPEQKNDLYNPWTPTDLLEPDILGNLPENQLWQLANDPLAGPIPGKYRFSNALRTFYRVDGDVPETPEPVEADWYRSFPG